MPEPRRRIDSEAAKRFIARFASAEEAVRRLMVDNYRQREKLRTGSPSDNGDSSRELEDLQTENDALLSKIPKDGQVVVSKEDAEALTKYKALGTPEEVKTKVDKSGELETKLTDKDREEVVRTAAKAAGFSETVLLDQVRSRGLTVEMRDQTADGKTVKVAFVKTSAKDAAFEPLTTMVERDLKDYLLALKASGPASTTPVQTGVPFPVQSSSGSAAQGDAADQFLARRNERAAARPNPLASPVAAIAAAKA